MAVAVAQRDGRPLTAEEQMVGLGLASSMRDARPIVCPPDQLAAIPDDVFADLGEAFDFARETRLPFPSTFIDFVGPMGDAPLVDFGITSMPMKFELRGVACAETEEPTQVVFLPVVGGPGEPPEELGMAILARDAHEGSVKPARWIESMPFGGGRSGDVTFFSPSTAMENLGETPRGVQGMLVGSARGTSELERRELLKMNLAVATSVAVRNAIKLLYLLDSENVDLAPMPVSRQVRRKAEREGGEIAWTVHVRTSTKSNAEKGDGSADYSHRFEVRGNFAHYGPGTRLYETSAPEKIRPCARCGTCRRVWRPPHVKGPENKPLVIKVRRLDEPHVSNTPLPDPR